MLVADPDPSDANEYAVFMQDEIEMNVVAVISDEHAQVVFVTYGLLTHVGPSRFGFSSLNLSLSKYGFIL